MEIIWSKSATTDYWYNISYLLEEWSEKEALVFTQEVERILHIIIQKPKTFKKVGAKELRTVPISPQISLLYRLKNSKTVELVRFWNNYQNPINKPS